jgi:hypothetical protein
MSKDDPLTDDDIEQYEQELADLSEKDLLVHILVELQAQRHDLAQLAEGQDRSESEDDKLFKCNLCGDLFAGQDRERHLVKQHEAPPGISVEGEFERVDE